MWIQFRPMIEEFAFTTLPRTDTVLSFSERRSAKICANPHAVSRIPGNVFAFKIIEYLAAGAHVISTPMRTLEPELERGMTYMRDNKPETIATTLKQVIESRSYERTAAQKALDAYGPETVSKALDQLIQQVMNGRNRKLEIEN